MQWQHKDNHLVRYEVEEIVINSTTGDKVYRVEEMGDFPPDFWEAVYEPVEE